MCLTIKLSTPTCSFDFGPCDPLGGPPKGPPISLWHKAFPEDLDTFISISASKRAEIKVNAAEPSSSTHQKQHSHAENQTLSAYSATPMQCLAFEAHRLACYMQGLQALSSNMSKRAGQLETAELSWQKQLDDVTAMVQQASAASAAVYYAIDEAIARETGVQVETGNVEQATPTRDNAEEVTAAERG